MNAFLRSMSGRVFLVLLLGSLTASTLAWWLAFGERQRVVTQMREARLVDLAEQFVLTLENLPLAERAQFLVSSRRFGLRAQLAPEPPPRLRDTGLSRALSQRLGSEYQVSAAEPMECPRPRRLRRTERSDAGPPPQPASPFHAAPFEEAGPPLSANLPVEKCDAVNVLLDDGYRITLTPMRLAQPSPRPDPLTYLVLFLLCTAALSYLVARMTVRPLQHLAQAAYALGNNIDRPPLPIEGPTEIRQASDAFNLMQERIREDIANRTQMLAAITHDLQTPLTRLRLRLEKVSDPILRTRLIKDLSATQAIVREGLDLARSIDSSEAVQVIDIDSLLDSICQDAIDAGQAVKLHGRSGMSISGQPGALRRCLINLIDNAVKYGRFAQVVIQEATLYDRPAVRIRIRDGGPGIAAQHMERIFEPFYRVENSRSRDTGGTGLGLTIANNIMRHHGGELELVNHPEGGLEASLILPATG